MRKFLNVAGVVAIAACGGSASTGFNGGGDGGGGYFFSDGGGSGDDDGGSTGDDDSSVPSGTPLTRQLEIDHISMFQATDAIMEKSGSVPSPLNAPVVAGRPGVLRVYVNTSSTWQPHQVTCTLQLNTGGTDQPPINVTLSPTGNSTDANSASTFNFPLTAAQITTDMQYSVAIRDTTMPAQADDATGAWYPTDGSLATPHVLGNLNFKIVLVPVQYNADQSGRLPDTDASQVALYQQTIYDVYPALGVSVTVRSQPYPISFSVGATDENAWGELLDDIAQLRAQDHVSSDTYYLGLFESADNENDYFSQGGGIEGLAYFVTSDQQDQERATLVIGYPGPDGPDTATQELAHTMGRLHAPCGNPANIDGSYPYSDAEIGVWGYNVTTQQYVNPASQVHDFMSYCDPIWTSDYTYNALAKWAVNVNAGALVAPAPETPYHIVSVRSDGTMVWRDAVNLTHAPGGEPHTVTFHSPSGAVLSTVTGYYAPHAHGSTGALYVPDPPAGAATMKVATLPQASTATTTLRLAR